MSAYKELILFHIMEMTLKQIEDSVAKVEKAIPQRAIAVTGDGLPNAIKLSANSVDARCQSPHPAHQPSQKSMANRRRVLRLKKDGSA